MAYHFSTTVKLPFEDAVEVTKAALKQHDVDFRPYRILGACNPQMAYKALQAEDKIGTMLPCNVVLQAHGNGMVEISAPPLSCRSVPMCSSTCSTWITATTWSTRWCSAARNRPIRTWP